MSNALKKITTRAKQLQKKHPNTKWVNLVKKAGADYRAGKLGKVGVAAKPKKKTWQTGSSVKRKDKQRKALAPGKRTSATGHKYTERRKNRSDVPGTLTGVSAATLTSELKSRIKEKLGKQLVRKELATTKRDRTKLGKEVRATKLQLKRLS